VETQGSNCEASRKKFTGPTKGWFPEIYNAVFTFFSREMQGWNKPYYTVLMAHTVTIIFTKSSSQS
jgi:hypothetical protein